MNTCTRCEGFAPTNLSVCPHCDADLPAHSTCSQLSKRVGRIAAAAATAMTLMACYGAPDGEDEGGRDIQGACNDAEPLQLEQTVQSSTALQGSSNAADLSCAEYGSVSEHMFVHATSEAGILHFEWSSDNPLVVAARDVCTSPATGNELLCEPSSTQGSVDLVMGAGEEVTLIVEGAELSSTFDYTATFTPSP